MSMTSRDNPTLGGTPSTVPPTLQTIQAGVKAATVAVAVMHPERPAGKNRPFTILGTGFCVHPDGIIVTCAHVHRSFVDPADYARVMKSVKDKSDKITDLKGAIPHVLFYSDKPIGQNLFAFPVSVETAISKTNYDLSAFKIAKHAAFRGGYPTLSIADHRAIHEMMDVATCGFPLGSYLEERIGTVTSSFSRGTLSSIIPASGVPREHIRGFQLDLRVTHGNSGGPVFSLATGQVFGVLQGGVEHPLTRVAVVAKAEPIYPIFDNDLVNRLLTGQRP
jgi:S1-C subfamily serine protease